MMSGGGVQICMNNKIDVFHKGVMLRKHDIANELTSTIVREVLNSKGNQNVVKN